jgi:hypothetical protein
MVKISQSITVSNTHLSEYIYMNNNGNFFLALSCIAFVPTSPIRGEIESGLQ